MFDISQLNPLCQAFDGSLGGVYNRRATPKKVWNRKVVFKKSLYYRESSLSCRYISIHFKTLKHGLVLKFMKVSPIVENSYKVRTFISFFLNSCFFFAFFDQVYDGRLQQLKKQSLDLRVRLREHRERPKALEMLRNSLNLSRTFLVQINNITDKDEIYTAKDLEELGKIINDTTVRCISLKFLRNVIRKRVSKEWL